jgi:cobyrinic acid a,c-diamide synthase
MKHALLIAGTHSGVGKTTVSAALMAALRRRGFTVIEAGVDLDRLLTLSAISAASDETDQDDQATLKDRRPASETPVRIGVACDRAFCFYYQDNFELLESLGAEIVTWSPMTDPLPAGLHGLYFGGGYPELYAAQLAANVSARESVNDFIAAGGAVYAECGGLMYLTEAIIDADGVVHPMVAVLPTRARMRGRLVALAYVEVEGVGGHTLLPEGETARGHQFRYSDIDPMPETIASCYRMRTRKPGDESRREGFVVHNCLASYVHLHFLSNPGFPARWLDCCRRSSVTT